MTQCGMPRDWYAGKGRDGSGDPVWFAWSPGSGIIVCWYGGAYADIFTAGHLCPLGAEESRGAWVRVDRSTRRGVSLNRWAVPVDCINLWDYEKDAPRIPRTTRGFLSAVRSWARDRSAA